MTIHSKLIASMIEYYASQPNRIQHFLKVHNFSKTIGELENLDAETLFILEAAAIVHDIGIKISEEKYGSFEGKYQELEGPAIAKPMLLSLGYSEKVIDRVCYLVAHHHTYTAMDGADYQILVEADFLVNIFEENMSKPAIQSVYEKIFRTATGKLFCRQLFNIE